MIYDGNNSYFPLICIGRGIPLTSGGNEKIDCLCISPSGRIAIIEQDPAAKGESMQDFLLRVSSYSNALRSWDNAKLDRIAAQYFYQTTGQAARVIDRMARCGYLTYSDNFTFSLKMNSGLQKMPHLVIVSVSDDNITQRKNDLSQDIFSTSEIMFSVSSSAEAERFQMP